MAQDDLLGSRGLAAVGNADRAVFFRRVIAARHPDRGIVQLLAVFVVDGEDMAEHRVLGDEVQATFVDHRAARFAVANEIDHIHARLVEPGELEVPLHPTQRAFLVRVDFLFVGNEAIQVDRCFDFVESCPIVAGRVDLEDFDDQFSGVLHPQIEPDGVA